MPVVQELSIEVKTSLLSPTLFSRAITVCACLTRFRIREYATLHFDSDYPVQRMMLVAPPSVQVSSPGFMPAGTEQGYNVYTRDAVPLGATFEVAVAGTAQYPLPPIKALATLMRVRLQRQTQDQGQGQDQVNLGAARE